MKLEDFTKAEQEQIHNGLPTSKLTNKQAAEKLMALVPKEWIQKIPVFVRKHAITKAVAWVEREYPDLWQVVLRQGPIPEEYKDELEAVMQGLFTQRMAKHKIKK